MTRKKKTLLPVGATIDREKIDAATKKFIRTMTDPEGQRAVDQIAVAAIDREYIDQPRKDDPALREAAHAAPETLRDRFAMAVMTGLLAAEDNNGELGEFDPGEFYVDRAYRYADEMMERRKR